MKSWYKPSLEFGGFLGWALSATYVGHKVIWLSMGGVGIYLLCNSTRVYFDRRAESLRKRPKDSAVREILRFFTREMFGEDASVRATVLLPDETNQYILPAHRYQYGGLPGRWSSNAKFPYGAAVAGFAWEEKSRLFKWDLDSFADERTWRQYYRVTLKMPDELINRLSQHVRKVRSIFCAALVNHRDDFIGVLSIDSTLPGTFAHVPEQTLKKFVSALQSTLEEV